MVQDNELVPDFPPGPLDLYRKQASFDWKKLKLFLEDEAIIEFKVMYRNWDNSFGIVTGLWAE
jgi:hypothetical protein